MADKTLQAQRLEAIHEYYRKAGAGDASLLDLFTDDFEFHYPKFGLGKGKEQFAMFHGRGSKYVASLGFNIDEFRYIVADDDIVVEGTEYGTLVDGQEFPNKQYSDGRFCAIFSFDGMLIRRMFSYTDPDLTCADMDRLRIFSPKF